MRTICRLFLHISVAIVAVGIFQEGTVNAEIQRNRGNAVLLGEWQPRESTTAERKGFFLSEISFTPGTKLAVAILLEQPGETVTVRWIMEAPGKPPTEAVQIVQDGGPNDLLPRTASIIFAFTEIPSGPAYPIDRYLVEVDDKSGNPPVRVTLEFPGDYLKSPDSAISKMAEMFWKIPNNIAALLLIRERALTKEAFRTLVVADKEGKSPRSLTPIQTGEIRSPIWLPTDQILFVEEQGAVSILKIISAALEGAPEDFGGTTTEGTDPHLTPDGKSIVFLQGTTVISANLSGTELIPLIQDREVVKILGIVPDPDPDSYHLVFSAKGPGSVVDQWSANIQGTGVISLRLLSGDSEDFDWFLLAEVEMYGEQMLYALWDKDRQAWDIYYSQSPEEEGTRINSDDSNARYPAWSWDGTKIVFVQTKRDADLLKD